MPIVTPDDLLEGVRRLWHESHIVDVTLVPNGIHHQRPPTGTPLPYGVASIVEGEPERFSGRTYIQPFTLKIAIYAESGSEGPKTSAIRRQLEASLRDTTTLAVPNADRVLAVRPVPGGLEYAAQMNLAQNVVTASGAWEVLVQATR